MTRPSNRSALLADPLIEQKKQKKQKTKKTTKQKTKTITLSMNESIITYKTLIMSYKLLARL